MLYKCAPQAPATDHGHTQTIKNGNKHLTVDIHCHVHVPECDTMVEGKWKIEQMPVIHFANDLTRELNIEQNDILMPKLTDPELRIKDMDSCGVDIQAISPSPFHYSYWADPELGRDVSVVANNTVGELGENILIDFLQCAPSHYSIQKWQLLNSNAVTKNTTCGVWK